MQILEFIHLNRNSGVPLGSQLAEQLTWLIANNELPAGERLPPIRLAARELGIHMHTVRSAYQILEQKKLVTSRPGQGTIVLAYTPFQFDRSEWARPIRTIGVIIPNFTFFYADFIKGVEEIARKAHWMMLVTNAQDDPLLAEKQLDELTSKNIDGVINASLGFSKEFQKKLETEQLVLPFPLVFADTPAATHSAVRLDCMDGARQAVVHLIEHGHDSIGLINGPQSWPLGEEILSAFQAGLQSRGAPMVSQAFINSAASFSIEAGYQAASKLLQSNLRPSAIFAVSDALAIGAMAAIKTKDLRVPQDVAVIGYGNIDTAGFVDPPLTTVTSPAFELGIESMNMLQDMILTKKQKAESRILPTNLVVRRSCGCDLQQQKTK